MANEESVSESLVGSAVRVLMRVAFVFEPFSANCNHGVDEPAATQV
jgi:hypothetical protein